LVRRRAGNGLHPGIFGRKRLGSVQKQEIEEPSRENWQLRYFITSSAVLFYLIVHLTVFVIFISRFSHLFDLIPDFV
jgi:hypothetical protein